MTRKWRPINRTDPRSPSHSARTPHCTAISSAALTSSGRRRPLGRSNLPLDQFFFISSDGYAVTNDHVVQHGVPFVIATEDGTTYTAKVVGADLRTDLHCSRWMAATIFRT
jgi:S1-C subfamily serine protease